LPVADEWVRLRGHADANLPLVRLGRFRAELHACYTRRADALFELGDALLCAPAVPSLPHLSLEPTCRRGWGSVYAALARGEVDAERLRDLLVSVLPSADPPVFAVDVTTWPRCDAECSPERGYYYHPSRHSAGQPSIAGWAYQWIAQLSLDRDCWTAPVDARRLHPLDDTDQTAAGQIRALLARLPASQAVPLFVFDGGYDSAQLTLDLADVPAAVLVRLRADRCFYADPPPAARSPRGGRPRRHGAKFNCADPTTWPAPTATLNCHDDQYGTVTVACWAGLHPKQQRHPGHGSRGPRPIVRGTVIRVQVERVPAKTRPPKVLWLWWAGPGQFDLDLVWRAYIRRFDLEHTVRFCKQTLGGTTPRPRHPEQADRWTWLVLAAYTQLRLARQLTGDQRLPWERP
jgi:DDE superfamily endonuclease